MIKFKLTPTSINSIDIKIISKLRLLTTIPMAPIKKTEKEQKSNNSMGKSIFIY
jgi:hypothetical protein